MRRPIVTALWLLASVYFAVAGIGGAEYAGFAAGLCGLCAGYRCAAQKESRNG